jgi:hypothetical protein
VGRLEREEREIRGYQLGSSVVNGRNCYRAVLNCKWPGGQKWVGGHMFDAETSKVR